MSEPYARIPDVNQRVESDITQGYKRTEAEHVARSDCDRWVVPPPVRENLHYPERTVASEFEQDDRVLVDKP